MAVKVRKITLWRGKIQNQPGALARVLEPLAAAGSDLQVLMGYREGEAHMDAVIELYPVSGRRLSAAVEAAGLSPSSIPTLLVSGDNRPGLGHAIARALAETRINIAFLVAQVVGRKYSAVFGFESDAAAADAAKRIKRAVAGSR
jgi:hypothetical protein